MWPAGRYIAAPLACPTSPWLYLGLAHSLQGDDVNEMRLKLLSSSTETYPFKVRLGET